MRYVFMVEYPGRDVEFCWTLDQAAEHAGGELWTDLTAHGRYTTNDGVLVTPYRLDLLDQRHLRAVAA